MLAEPELEELLLRIVPNLGNTWRGAPPEEIAELEEVAGRPLPPFYQWFLNKMGRSMGALSNGIRDLSAWTALARYREGWALPEPRYLLIGYEPDDVMPMHIYYDLERPARDDALVLSQPVGAQSVQRDFETLREMLAWGAMLTFQIDEAPQRCYGSINHEGKEVRSRLEPVMESLGFKRPIPTGDFCALFERPGASMVASVSPGDAPKPYLFFRLGASDEATIRRILGAVATDAALSVEIDSWEPRLP